MSADSDQSLAAGSTPELPVATWQVDAQGRLLAPAALPGQPGRCLPAGFINERLTSAYRVLWELTIWPALGNTGVLDEVVLEVWNEGSEPVQLLSFWRRRDGPGGQAYVVMVVPGAERAQLMAQLRRAQDSLDAMPGAILQVQPVGGQVQFPYASGPLLDLLGVTYTQVLADAAALLDSLTPESRQALQDALEQAERQDTPRWLVVLQPRRWPQRRIELAAQRRMAAGPWHCVLVDVTERERLLHELTWRAETDSLTSLFNRSGLLSQLAQRLMEQRPFAMLFMDCDRFKQINDSLGHALGDQLLRMVSQRLRGCLRPGDVIAKQERDAASVAGGADPYVAARLGGDEFVVIADGVRTPADAATLAERLVRTLAQPYQLSGQELVLTVSMGVVLAGPHSDPEQLLRDSDTAMYEAKRGGRSRWVLFEPEMQQRVASAMTLENRLRHALAIEGRVFPVFQPIVDIASGAITGFEALARWRDPEHGFINPAHFIPVAEDSGQIAVLGELILRQACTQFVAWNARAPAARQRLSVNVSRAQLTDAALPARVEKLLAEIGMPPQRLQLEVTESLAMAEDDGSLQVLHRLRELGCRLSLDDFGTGYSSLAALHRLPVQQVKLDRSFINEIETSPYHLAVVKAALEVAQVLSLEVVAEGVETEAQARTLRSLGCARAQGWLYSKAVEAGDAEALLRRLQLGPALQTEE
ncbi:putative bifunctional diguanylate cyclase/phosphodiesterase [Azohydromonas australica]|uniref:putative bifunctional diguanylate cyclase/phosphodiesterase n=1 Tax=Azohydromonas australica TaxID=364039 RepID=UPI0003F82EA4|nr:EAL domain-containing protein [Azohydromonas australica]